MSKDYDYGECLAHSVKNNWSVEDCFQGRDFNFDNCFLPDKIAGLAGISCLSPAEKKRYNQIRGNSYCHIFSFVEEFIIPVIVKFAASDLYDAKERMRFLLRFAEEEAKHQEMLARAMSQITQGLGHPCQIVEGKTAVARTVVGKSSLSVLMLISMIEWFTQQHYVEHVKGETALDPLFRDILKYHWIDEAQHAKADTLLVREELGKFSLADRDAAVEEFIELCRAVDGILQQQITLDITTFETITGRILNPAEKDELTASQLLAYRWTFLVSGLTHKEFVSLVDEISPRGRPLIQSFVSELC